jgi:hypothetical protein
MDSLTQRIDRALAWLEENREGVAAALPLRVGGVIYLPTCLDKLDGWVRLYREGGLNPRLAEAYILTPLRGLYAGFKHGTNADR